ncbi:MAG TPA: hypothetical protein EYP98_06885 [Planctomycetes bacterium]|nr:hypothetical protein [Planctomycetota bacterium]
MAACDGVLVLSGVLPSEDLAACASTVGGIPATAFVEARTKRFYVRLKNFEASEKTLELRQNVWWFTFVEIVGLGLSDAIAIQNYTRPKCCDASGKMMMWVAGVACPQGAFDAEPTMQRLAEGGHTALVHAAKHIVDCMPAASGRTVRRRLVRLRSELEDVFSVAVRRRHGLDAVSAYVDMRYDEMVAEEYAKILGSGAAGTNESGTRSGEKRIAPGEAQRRAVARRTERA